MISDTIIRNLESLIKQYPNHLEHINRSIDKLIVSRIDKSVEQNFLGCTVSDLVAIKRLINLVDEGPITPPQIAVKQEAPIVTTTTSSKSRNGKR